MGFIDELREGRHCSNCRSFEEHDLYCRRGINPDAAPKGFTEYLEKYYSNNEVGMMDSEEVRKRVISGHEPENNMPLGRGEPFSIGFGNKRCFNPSGRQPFELDPRIRNAMSLANGVMHKLGVIEGLLANPALMPTDSAELLQDKLGRLGDEICGLCDALMQED